MIAQKHLEILFICTMVHIEWNQMEMCAGSCAGCLSLGQGEQLCRWAKHHTLVLTQYPIARVATVMFFPSSDGIRLDILPEYWQKLKMLFRFYMCILAWFAQFVQDWGNLLQKLPTLEGNDPEGQSSTLSSYLTDCTGLLLARAVCWKYPECSWLKSQCHF